ncbi:vWA domain-containing protein [Aeromicrobium wangtongii]|uniref:VWA domain-containing protein n=1 Tax=Aeromicrobium wangtongii TaxID=2969247 RepID=A0ABY5M5L9_9ACTN|nr:VWA domain-containing protein [Aeromicrobium wangtongii]MCD9198322.1 VWA domain-containing protein [Aeromicrobium wangtongii]UUP12354.1 VWA domain-containing protein [Aeromicrobium wangtongii]
MELNTRLDRDRYTWMSPAPSDRASMLVEITSPELPRSEHPVPTHLVVVLDRSGSMDGAPLDHAKDALCDVVDRLAPTDTFGLVTFDNQVDVIVPAGPVTDRGQLKARIRAISAGGSTDVAAGLVRGLKEARRLETTEGARVLLVSDGHTNHGVVDAAVIAQRAGQFLEHRITTSVLGMGLGYDEMLLESIAKSGAGNNYFAQESGDAVEAIAAECGELLAQRFLSVRLSVTLGNGVKDLRVLGDLNARPNEAGVVVELGSFTADQMRSVVMQFTPKQATKPGRRKVATVRVSYVLADDLQDYSVSHTVWANVAGPNDRPAKVDREVMAEVVFQGVQLHKRRATDAVQSGDLEAARRRYERALRMIRRHWAEIPLERRAEFEQDRAFIEKSLRRLDEPTADDMRFIGKAMTANLSMSMRTRDRRRSPGA